jgi:hypothetical protein
MENNRRSFFKGLAAFASGVVAAKVASYTPKKEEPKEEVMVSNAITLIGPKGEPYHPLVVKKTSYDEMELAPMNIGHSYVIQPPIPKIREAKIQDGTLIGMMSIDQE